MPNPSVKSVPTFELKGAASFNFLRHETIHAAPFNPGY